jgi:hypothetical protein
MGILKFLSIFKMDKDTAKHLAQTLRIIGVSQFANYG